MPLIQIRPLETATIQSSTGNGFKLGLEFILFYLVVFISFLYQHE